MERTLKDTYTVAVDDNSGRIVILTNGAKVVGALTREQSVHIAQNIIDWMPPLMRPTIEQTEPINGTPS